MKGQRVPCEAPEKRSTSRFLGLAMVGIAQLQKTASVYLCIRLGGIAQAVEVSPSLIRMIVWRLVLKSRASAATASPCWRR